MKREYVQPVVEKVSFDYEDQIVVASGNPQALNYIRDHADAQCHNTSCATN